MGNKREKIAVIGLGYVGLPLVLAFGKHYETIGYDIDRNRIEDLIAGNDYTNEVEVEDLKQSDNIQFTSSLKDIQPSNIFIITVPTPIDSNNNPDLTAIIKSTEVIGSILKVDDIVVYESTVYPGLTEEICVPILESYSGLKANKDFSYGYSPERINPGDKEHRLKDIVKIISGSNEKATEKINNLYTSIISAGTHKANSIKVAEAAKVIENIQRDVNIALINELSIIFKEMGISTQEVLEASSTKWNFHSYHPGLVGGHCIGVDPHYLAYKANLIGITPQMINAGRSINENMSRVVADEVLNLLSSKKIDKSMAKVLILGFSFKANCPDSRNTKVADLFNALKSEVYKVEIHDPTNDKHSVYAEYNISLVENIESQDYDCVILAVGHDEFENMGLNKIRALCKENHVLYDVAYMFESNEVDGRL